MDNVPIFYVNLERSRERRERMEAMFREWKLDRYTRVEAFDGAALVGDPQRLAYTVSLPPNHGMNPGELGCTLSHLRVAEMVLASGHAYALVMEDDIHLTYLPLWKTTLEEIVSQAPLDWQVRR
jgi:glycosyl transferase family 25